MSNVLRSFAPRSLDLNGKDILITGGTGSFGQMFVRHVLEHYSPNRLIVFSRDEAKQYEMADKYKGLDPESKLRFFIGDVRDIERLKMAVRGVDYIIHAAAMKHVPTAEYNPFECIRTNVHGAENVVTAAIHGGVPRVIALSTDKATNPINLYGASKLASDKIFVAANHLSGIDETRFSVVRYGNVLGSRGSVVPLFQRLIAEGAKRLPITHPEMTRFWITLDQGVRFVLSSLEMMSGGEVFVPKIPSMRVIDLAKVMAPNLPVETIGIRPGEKMHEIMITTDDARNTVEIEDRYVIEPELPFWNRARDRAAGSRPVEQNFSYTSDGNSEWLSAEQMTAILNVNPAHKN